MPSQQTTQKSLLGLLKTKGYEVGITSLGDQILSHQRFKKGNKELLDFINDDIQKLGKEKLSSTKLMKKLFTHYDDAAKADDLVVEGGEVK